MNTRLNEIARVWLGPECMKGRMVQQHASDFVSVCAIAAWNASGMVFKRTTKRMAELAEKLLEKKTKGTSH